MQFRRQGVCCEGNKEGWTSVNWAGTGVGKGLRTPGCEVQSESALVFLNKFFLFLPRAADSLHATWFWREFLCNDSAVSVFEIVVFVVESGSLR